MTLTSVTWEFLTVKHMIVTYNHNMTSNSIFEHIKYINFSTYPRCFFGTVFFELLQRSKKNSKHTFVSERNKIQNIFSISLKLIQF